MAETRATKSNNISKSLLRGVKVIVTCSLLYVIIANLDWDGITSALQRANLWLILLVLAAMAVNVFVSAYKWQVLLTIHRIHIPLWLLSSYYFTASFFNNFLPSTVGGDGYRIYRTIQDSGLKQGPVIAVLMERITGILALIFLGFIGGIVSYCLTGDKVSQFAVVSGFLFFASAALISFMAIRREELIKKLSRRLLTGKFRTVLSRLVDYRRNPVALAEVVLLSVSFQIFLLVYRLVLIIAVGETISIFNLAVVTAISTIVALIPISINGYGLLDGSVIYLLVNFGLAYDEAVIVMVLIRVLNISLSFLGGIIYVFDKRIFRMIE